MALPSSAADEPHIAHFLAIPWARDLIQSTDYTVTPSQWRLAKDSTEDELLAVTLNTPATVSHHLALYRKPQSNKSSTANNFEGVREMKLLVTMGAGVNGWPGICHGGVIATLVDELMGALVNLHRAERQAAGRAGRESTYTLTAQLDVSYKAPVRTPGTHVLTVELEKMDGRKLWLVGRIEDKDGKVCILSKGLFLLNKTNLRDPKL